MKQEQFEKRHSDTWLAFETSLDRFQQGETTFEEVEDFDRRYRQICKHLSLATGRHYSTYLVERLNLLAMRGHQVFYRRGSGHFSGLQRLIAWEFPQAVRREAKLFWICSLIFYGPFFVMIGLLHHNPDLIYDILPAAQISQYESMYAEADQRDVSMTDRFTMFGHYINNNISIAFRTFAGGIFAGVGSLIIMLFNGFFIGVIFGHLGQMPYSQNFYSFVCTHGAFELTAIVLAGVAGFRIGLAVIAPGPWSRREALRQAGESTLPIVYGMTLFLVIAAFIEAFYSPIHFNTAIKYPLALATWMLVFAYLGLAGRRREH